MEANFPLAIKIVPMTGAKKERGLFEKGACFDLLGTFRTIDKAIDGSDG